MNIKSLILGSAAAIVAGGAAQAADLPVAEPVDYVKVCDAYGTGYYFIPGTDTCLKISGSITFAFEGYPGDFQPNTNEAPYDQGGSALVGHWTRDDALINMYTETTFKFTAREETEWGTLTGHMEFDDTGDGTAGGGTAFDKAYIQLGGFYAGLTDSIIDFNAGHGYDDFGFGQGDLNAIGYKADMGNGVEVALAVEEYQKNVDVYSITTVGSSTGNNYYDPAALSAPGTSMPALAARVKVSQGWGSVQLGASVFQVRYANAMYSTDMGYNVGGKVVFNVAEGLKLGLAGGYSAGGSIFTDDNTYTAINGKLNTGWALSAGLEYAFADNFTIYFDGGYETHNDRSALNTDLKAWGTSAKFKYTPVKNLDIKGKVGYRKVDYSNAYITANGGKDWDSVAAKLEITRSF